MPVSIPLRLVRLTNGGTKVKYILLIYADEQLWTEAERERCYGESTDLAEELRAKGQCLAALPLQDMFWGDRYGLVADPFGHQWSIATSIRKVSTVELQEAVAAMAGA